jgi:predicted phosphodiesterase/biotin operon repressor
MARKKTRRTKSNAIVEWAKEQPEGRATPDDVRKAIRREARTLSDIAERLKCSRGSVLDAIDALISEGVNVQQWGDAYQVSRQPAPLEPSALHKLTSDARGRYRFGVISDTHLGSKYARLDVMDSLYDWFAAEKIRLVYHAGNWIDGEKPGINKFDLIPEAHGLQAQLDYMVKRYPQRAGMQTHYVAGDDHEGWYAQREGVDPGKLLQMTAEGAGRKDLKYLGYMESFVTLEHRQTGETAKLLVCHPGGGSAYAVSYAPQKIAESWQPGEKPGVAIFGHYHKLEYLVTRGVHSIQAGCTKETDPWARKRRLAYHIGGWIVELYQGEAGAIERCRPECATYFDRGYYNYQWSHSDAIRKVPVPGSSRKRKASRSVKGRKK